MTDWTRRVPMSDELRWALQDWLDWAEDGAPEDGRFRRFWGLCSQMPTRELRQGLKAVFGRERYPFGYDDYYRRGLAHTQHEAPMRLAFARANAERRP